MKTYVFGIGGTGARVIKSLVMLMSAGIDMHTDEIVPIFIDPDNAAADLTRTVTVLRSYQIINEHILFTKDVEDKFFKTRIGEPISGFKMNLANVSNGTFAQYMNFGTLSVENQALARILFSDINWGTMMDVGFKGNPNIGSVVLNQFTRSQDFVDFAANFQQGDRIFIISSIFGGTGASGFPLLLKNLRGIDSKLPNADFAHIEEEYLATIDSLNWPDGITLPDKLEDEDTGASFQVGYGETRASYLWEYSWMKEWLDTYNTDPERAEKALEELEKAFDMPYMGIDRCDDATRNYLRENIDKAKLGDPSGFTESIRANYAN